MNTHATVLIINAGSSSLKLALWHLHEQISLLEGLVENIGQDNGQLHLKSTDGHLDTRITLSNASHDGALTAFKAWLTIDQKRYDIPIAIGHRVVHGGELFKESVLIDDHVVQQIEKCSLLAPLHNPVQLSAILTCRTLFENAPQVAVFDTAFHQTIAIEQFLYPIPYHYYTEHALRKYGFHGTSYRYVSVRLGELSPESLKQGVLIAHLGNGASTCAIEKGKSVDTSMGLTPLEGLMMGTRSGSIDPSLIDFLQQIEGISSQSALDILNKKSGLLGISQRTNDCRQLEMASQNGDSQATLALDMFCIRAAKSLMSVATTLESIEHLVFTGGIGENSIYIRHTICHHLHKFSIKLDTSKNQQVKRQRASCISAHDSQVKIWVIPTNEEKMIAQDTIELIKNYNGNKIITNLMEH